MTSPSQDLPAKKTGTIRIKAVHGFDEMAMVVAIRAAVFMGEMRRSYREEFDGNDHAATHLLAFVDDEPVGAFRIRWFADFAKLERLSILEPYRNVKLVNALIREALDLSRRKGYQFVYGRALQKVVPLWQRFGASACGPTLETARGTATPLTCPIRPDATQATPISGAMLGASELDQMLSHAEGEWPEIEIHRRHSPQARSIEAVGQ